MNRRVADLYKALQDAEEEIVSLGEDIRAGKKTLGSKFDNFVFCSVGANPVAWEPFYQLDEQMKNSEGKELLVVCSKDTLAGGLETRYVSHGPGQFGCVGPMQENFMPPVEIKDIEYNLAYGVLTGKGLDFDLETSEIIFPNGRKYAEVSGNSLFGMNLTLESLDVVRGRIRKEVGDLLHLHKSFDLGMLPFLAGKRNSQILVGGEVAAYFGEMINGDKAYSEIKKML